MSYPSEAKEELIGFCSAPWTDCITYADGALRACDRTPAAFGNWQEKGLKNTWESEQFQDFRRAMREGRFPNADCASCYNNGTQRTATSSLIGAYAIHYDVIKKHLGLKTEEHVTELAHLHPLLSLKKRNADSDRVIPAYFAYLDRFAQEHREAVEKDEKLAKAITKLKVIGESLEDYLHGALKPRRVATFRQSQLQAKCTARCVMCVGKYTKEIETGPTMEGKWVDEAFAEPEDITDFWCNGAEYLFFKEWKQVALMLHKEGVRMRCSTNGILLNENTIDFMVDNDLLGFLTMSLDAATKETMESTRVRVNFDKNMARVKYLLKRATDLKQNFEFVAAFVMMNRNLRELPAFVRLMKSLMPEGCTPKVYVLCQPLENFDIDGYRQFVHREHHSLLGEAELRRIFTETYEAQKETGINVTFYNQHLKDFVEAGMPFPRYFPRQSDVDIFLADVRKNVPLWREGELDPKRLAREAGYDTEAFRRAVLHFVRDYCEKNGVIAETQRVFPAFANELAGLLPAYAAVIASRYEEQELDATSPAGTIRVMNLPLGPVREGDFIYSYDMRNSGKVIRIAEGFALLHDGAIVRLGETVRLLAKSGPRPEVGEEKRLLLGHFYLWLHTRKNRLLGGVKSPVLWKLSVAYRWLLGVCGVNVAFRETAGS